MRAEHVDAFLASAFEILGQAAGARPERGSPVLRSGPTVSARELTALVALQGDLVGVLFCSMSLATAAKLERVLGPGKDAACPVPPSVAATLAAMVCNAASTRLGQSGLTCDASEPLLAEGFGEPLTGISPVLVIPIFTTYGDMDVGLALQPPEALVAGAQLVMVRPSAAREPDAEVPAAAEEGLPLLPTELPVTADDQAA